MFKLKRLGTHPVKILFSVEVQSVYLPLVKDKDLQVGAPVSVCFERGGKMVTSQDHAVAISKNHGAHQPADKQDLVAEIGETLRLVATLYRTGNNTYQDKSGKLVVRQRHAGEKPKGANAFKGIGIVKLSLNTIAGSFAPTKMTLVLMQCSIPGAVVNVVVTAKVLGDGEDDTMSQMSGMSDISCEAADFGDSSFNGSATGTHHSYSGGAHGGIGAGVESFLGGIAEETDNDLTQNEDRQSYADRTSDAVDRIMKAAATPKGGEDNSGTPNRLTHSGDSHENKNLPSRTEGAMDTIATEVDEKEDEGQNNANTAMIGQALLNEKIREISKLRSQLDSYTSDHSKLENKLLTANMIINAETKRSKKLKEELDGLGHSIHVLEKLKAEADEKLKHVENENNQLKATSIIGRPSDSQTTLQDDRKEASEVAEVAALQIQINTLKSDRDVYKTELEETRLEVQRLRERLERGYSYEDHNEEDKDDVISALRSQLGSFQVLAEDEKTELSKQLEQAKSRWEREKKRAAEMAVELEKASIQALAFARDAWELERRDLEIRLKSAEDDAHDMIEDIEELRRKLKISETKVECMDSDRERERDPSPVPTRSTDGPAPMLRQLSKMKSFRATMAGSTKISTDEFQLELDSINLSHQNELAAMSKELDTLRAKVVILEGELDSADQRLATVDHELKLTKLELWETLDKVETQPAVRPAEKRESLRTNDSNTPVGVESSAALLDELISLKLEFATLANTRDLERLDMFALKRRVNNYAVRVANLEVELAMATDRERNEK